MPNLTGFSLSFLKKFIKIATSDRSNTVSSEFIELIKDWVKLYASLSFEKSKWLIVWTVHCCGLTYVVRMLEP